MPDPHVQVPMLFVRLPAAQSFCPLLGLSAPPMCQAWGMGTVMDHVPPDIGPEGARSAPSPRVDGRVDPVMGGTRSGGERRLGQRQWEEMPGLTS